MIDLSDEEGENVEVFIGRGKANAGSVTRAHILLQDAEGWRIPELAKTFGVSPTPVGHVRKRYREESHVAQGSAGRTRHCDGATSVWKGSESQLSSAGVGHRRGTPCCGGRGKSIFSELDRLAPDMAIRMADGTADCHAQAPCDCSIDRPAVSQL